MIAVDTSALMAIILDEPQARCASPVEAEKEISCRPGRWRKADRPGRRNVGGEMTSLIDGLGFEIVTITPAAARRIAEAYGRWGRGVHPAGLNLGDCFAYEVAKEHGCRLLYIGEDFSKTDVESAL